MCEFTFLLIRKILLGMVGMTGTSPLYFSIIYLSYDIHTVLSLPVWKIHQLLHQGSELIPVDFILPLHSHSDELNKQAHLVANCLAQSKALTEGKTREQALQEMLDSGTPQAQAGSLAPHKTVAGNRPNTIIVMDKLTPENLGALIALYEHKVFVESVVWEINAFDQWGVELGKQLSTPIFAALTGTKKQATDKTTEFWVNAFTQG